VRDNRGGWLGTRIDALPLRRGWDLIGGHLSFLHLQKFDALMQVFQDEYCFVEPVAIARVFNFI
jgi:hypothetical protein